MTTATGRFIWEWENEPFADILALLTYWADWPPLHELAAMYLGVKPKRRAPQQDAIEMGKTFKDLAPATKGRSKSKDRAPLHIQQMIDAAKKGKKNG